MVKETTTERSDQTTQQSLTLNREEWSQFHQILFGYLYSQILHTACELDLFTFLSKNPKSDLDDIQKALNLSPNAARLFMAGCCVTGLVHKDVKDNCYSNTPLSEKLLVKDSPHSMYAAVRYVYECNEPAGKYLTQSLKEDRNVALDKIFPGKGNTTYERFKEYPDIEKLFQEAMACRTRISHAGDYFEEDFSQAKHVLDVGGGAGSNAIRLCRKYPKLKVTILDVPTVAQRAYEAAEKAGLTDRITCVPGDATRDEWPANVDTVLFSHVLSLFSADKLMVVLKKAYDVLPKGGRVLCWALSFNEAYTGPLVAVQASLHSLVISAGHGLTFSDKSLEDWLKQVGFKTVKSYEKATAIDHSAIVGIK